MPTQQTVIPFAPANVSETPLVALNQRRDPT